MTVTGTGAATVAGDVPGEGHGSCFAGELDDDIGIAVSGSVARTVVRIPCTVRPVAEGAGKTGVRRGVAPGNIWEGGAVRPPGGQGAGAGDTMARPAAVAGTGLGVASTTIGR